MRLRFAPSPTGNLHLGTLRTALFNWLVAKHHNGILVLRIEDTDLNRSESHYETSINDGLDWLGITLDEGEFNFLKDDMRTELMLNVDRLLSSQPHRHVGGSSSQQSCSCLYGL